MTIAAIGYGHRQREPDLRDAKVSLRIRDNRGNRFHAARSTTLPLNRNQDPPPRKLKKTVAVYDCCQYIEFQADVVRLHTRVSRGFVNDGAHHSRTAACRSNCAIAAGACLIESL